MTGQSAPEASRCAVVGSLNVYVLYASNRKVPVHLYKQHLKRLMSSLMVSRRQLILYSEEPCPPVRPAGSVFTCTLGTDPWTYPFYSGGWRSLVATHDSRTCAAGSMCPRLSTHCHYCNTTDIDGSKKFPMLRITSNSRFCTQIFYSTWDPWAMLETKPCIHQLPRYGFPMEHPRIQKSGTGLVDRLRC